LVVSYFDWQSIFLSLALYALTVLFLLLWRLPETNPKFKRASSKQMKPNLYSSYKRIFSHRQAMGYVVAISFGFSGMFVFITSSAFTYMEYFSVSVQLFPLLFGANVIVMMLMNRINVWVLNHYSSKQILTTGLILQACSGIALIISSYFDPGLYLIVGLNMLFVGSLGLIAANATAGVLNYFPDISGTATAVIGVSEFTLGALVGILWSYLHELYFISYQEFSLSPMAWVMAACSFTGLCGLKLLSRSKPLPQPI
jgi:DHA1 family bicyclomycin/chloramphenicol resistance-like MFS transporter